jgi:hypothetical protein
MVPAAGADCVSWISENMVERSEGRAPARGHFAADAAGCSRLMGEDDTGTLARLAGVAHAMCDVSDELVADLGRRNRRDGAADHRNRRNREEAGVRPVDAARKRVPITASGWQHF